MRDIGARIRRHRLERYAPPRSGWRRQLRWIPWLAACWFFYATFLSEHSLHRIWRMQRESRQAEARLASMRREIERLESDLKSPERQRRLYEHHLREQNGMALPGEIIYRVQPDTAR